MSDIKCPKCEAEFNVENFATVPPEQRLTFSIERAGGDVMLSAATCAGYIGNIDKLLKSVAKEIGARVHVFVERIDWQVSTVAFHFVIINVAGAKRGSARATINRALDGLAAVSREQHGAATEGDNSQRSGADRTQP